MNTIIVAEISEKNGWANLKTNEGKEISIMLSKCPKLEAQIKQGVKPGDELTGKIVEKDGKSYMWDVSDTKPGGGGKSFAPADKSFQAAVAAINAAAQLWSLDKDKSDEKVLASASKFHEFLLSKVTK